MKLKIYCGNLLRQPIKYIRHTEVYQLNKCSRMIFISKVTSRALLQHQVKCLTMTWKFLKDNLQPTLCLIIGSLSALVYQHSLMPLALPCKLSLPESDTRLPSETTNSVSTAQMLLAQGAGITLLYCFLYFCITVLWNKTLSNFKRQHTYLMLDKVKYWIIEVYLICNNCCSTVIHYLKIFIHVRDYCRNK